MDYTELENSKAFIIDEIMEYVPELVVTKVTPAGAFIALHPL